MGSSDLDGREQLLVDGDELYLRQCHPSFLKGDQPSAQFLADFPRDEGQLSGTRSSVVTATESYLDHISRLKQDGSRLLSAGTWGVSVAEVSAAGTQVVDDSGMPQVEPPRPRGHCYLDLRKMERAERRKITSELLIRFQARGQLAQLADFEKDAAAPA